MKIKAAVVHKKGGPFVIEELELDEPRADEVLVRMTASGLCHTDLAGRDQLLPLAHSGVFGHEGAGVVEKVGSDVKKVQPGDHVVMSYLYCGVCPACKSGAPGRCVDFFALNFSGARADGSLTMRKGKEKIHGSFFGQSGCRPSLDDRLACGALFGGGDVGDSHGGPGLRGQRHSTSRSAVSSS